MSAPRILIVYGTTHGQTAKIASHIQEVLEADDFQVTVANVKEKPVPSLSGFHGVIVGASVIARGHQPAVAAFIREHLATLNAMPTAFFSVSASAGSAREGGRAAARRVRDAFLAETGFSPVISECVAGAIRYTRYNLLLRWYMKRASRMNGGSTDTSRDHEYTDWAQVRNFALAFADLFRLRAQVADMARGQGRETLAAAEASLRGAEPTIVHGKRLSELATQRDVDSHPALRGVYGKP